MEEGMMGMMLMGVVVRVRRSIMSLEHFTHD